MSSPRASEPIDDEKIVELAPRDQEKTGDGCTSTDVTDGELQSSEEVESISQQPAKRQGLFMRIVEKIDYVPKRCRWDPENPPKLTWALCLLFAFASAFTVSNLYYNHPILNVLADDFGVSFEEASRVPTLMQAGYAAGLLFICPLGDVMRRRPLTLFLIFVTANIWLGLCITTSFNVFLGLSFLAALTTVTPQLMLPLVAELAPARRRATMISIVFGGLFMGILLARILSGIVTEFSSWRTIYFVSFGLQYLLLILLFFYFPDYPLINPEGVSYFQVLWTIIRIPMRQPLLVQTSLISFFVSASFVSFWTTLTFLLASPPFNLSTLDIGLFALIGMPPFLINPYISHLVTDRYNPVYACLIGLGIGLTGILIGTFVGTFSLAGPVFMGLLLDLGMIVSQTACRTQLVVVEPKARNRVNTVFMVAGFCGMLMGTAVGNSLYAQGGWHYSGGADIAFFGAAVLITLVRGPHEKGWVGWRGGWRNKPSGKKDEEHHESGASSQMQEVAPGAVGEAQRPPQMSGAEVVDSESPGETAPRKQ